MVGHRAKLLKVLAASLRARVGRISISCREQLVETRPKVVTARLQITLDDQAHGTWLPALEGEDGSWYTAEGLRLVGVIREARGGHGFVRVGPENHGMAGLVRVDGKAYRFLGGADVVYAVRSERRATAEADLPASE